MRLPGFGCRLTNRLSLPALTLFPRLGIFSAKVATFPGKGAGRSGSLGGCPDTHHVHAPMGPPARLLVAPGCVAWARET